VRRIVAAVELPIAGRRRKGRRRRKEPREGCRTL